MHLTGTMRINGFGNLEIGGVDATKLVEQYQTPLWVIDETGFRENCRAFRNAFRVSGDTLVLYASKALCNTALCKIVNEEGLGLDVVSGGELFTAMNAGFPMEKVYFHGNNKSPGELEMAVALGVGRVVVDNFQELKTLNQICQGLQVKQDILLRITPGVEAHTHEFIKTGQIDSKFGFTLPGGQAMEAVQAALGCGALKLVGLHCHIGSQIFEMESFEHAAELMMHFMADVKELTGHEFQELDIGGGFGIYYFPGDEPRKPDDWAQAVTKAVQSKADQYGLKKPRIIVEPGRAIVGPAGITLYTVGSSKEVPGIRKYIAVDGGMTDNPRPALYGSKYLAMVANKAVQEATEQVSIAGKCCESGDMLIWDARLAPVESGDIVAVFATGAYNYAMSSNYNRIPRPAMILVKDGKSHLILKRETYQDIVRNDLVPDYLK
ncbi:MAG TPA: diaminopimelate decarboxylase [Syntrophomonas sp.]|nr:diaminopimelate decarboxylase [Syntrophomonas sp.]